MMLLVVCSVAILGMCAGYDVCLFIARRSEAQQQAKLDKAYELERDRLRLMAHQYGLGFDEIRSNAINRYRIEMRLKYPNPITRAIDSVIGAGMN